jgi:proline iminopeptidase
MPNAELVVFEHSGHSPQMEEAERFQAVMREFLARVFPELSGLAPGAEFAQPAFDD